MIDTVTTESGKITVIIRIDYILCQGPTIATLRVSLANCCPAAEGRKGILVDLLITWEGGGEPKRIELIHIRM